MASELYTAIKKTASDFIASYGQLEGQSSDFHKISSTLSKDCLRDFGPASMFAGLPGISEGWTNTQYEEQMRKEFTTVWTGCRVQVNSIIVDEVERKAVVYSTHTMTEKNDKEWVMELIYFLDMTNDGSKIAKILEYVDTQVTTRFVQEHSEVLP